MSVAFAPREQLEGSYIDAVTREGFRIAHEISSYSFAALAKAGADYIGVHVEACAKVAHELLAAKE